MKPAWRDSVSQVQTVAGLSQNEICRRPGCWRVLTFLAHHPNCRLTLEDLAFQTGLEPQVARVALRHLVRNGLVVRLRAARLTFFGLTSDPQLRDQARALCRWRQRRGAELEYAELGPSR